MAVPLKRWLPRVRSPRDAGYTLVVLAVAVTVMSVLVAAALPYWSHALQREKEEELIFRGWQYAEALRVFTQRTGRYPTHLKELMEVKPRSIRRLWKDPMTEEGTWALIVSGLAPGQNNNPNNQNNPGVDDSEAGDGIELPSGGGSVGGPGGGPGTPVGPITGVRSRSKDEAIKMLFGKEKYSEWEFTVESLVSGGKSAAGGSQVVPPGNRPVQNPNPLPGFTGATAHPQLPKTPWIGRPFREGLQPGGGLTPPGGNPQGGGLQGGGLSGGGIGPGTVKPPTVDDDDN